MLNQDLGNVVKVHTKMPNHSNAADGCEPLVMDLRLSTAADLSRYAASPRWGKIASLFADIQERSTMTEAIETQIINAEERLRQATLASDVSVLNELLAPEIIITSHLGELLDDLAALIDDTPKDLYSAGSQPDL